MTEGTGTVAGRLARLGLQLPPPPVPVATFEPYVRHGGTIYVSGQIAVRDGRLVAAGRLEQPQVADGASQPLLDVLGAAGAHARSAIGVAALPLGTPVEVEAIAQVSAGAVSREAQPR
ncbi:MAG TPA: RidA family protein [Trebonia sp.]